MNVVILCCSDREMAEMLMRHGANVNALDIDSNTPLLAAITTSMIHFNRSPSKSIDM